MPKIKHIEATVADVERFKIRIMQNGADVRGDKVVNKQYDAGKMAKNSYTVSQWKENRFRKQFPGYDVDVLNADGSVARGNTLLSTVRYTYLT